MQLLRETAASFSTGLRMSLARPRHTLLIAFGFLVAGITLAVLLTLPAGLNRLAGNTGASDIAVVMSGNAFEESGESFKPALAALAGSLPGVAHSRNGQPLVAPQFVVETRLRRTDGSTTTVLLRGVTPVFWNIVGHAVSMRSGRRFAAGKDELIAGIAAARGFVALDTGATTSINRNPWHVSGEFAAGGGFWESELWTDMSALQSAYHAQGVLTCLWVKLTSPAAVKAFKRALHDNPPTQGLHAVSQRDYYTDQTWFMKYLITAATQGVAVALGLGAILAIINALGLALAARGRELAIQRAIGFRRGSLALALLVEVLVVGASCAGISVLVAWLAVNGHEVGSSTGGSAIEFRMHVGSAVIGWTFMYVLILGVLSALWPIAQAVRAPLTKTLQDE
jgi:putative ABC transport system permease protein